MFFKYWQLVVNVMTVLTGLGLFFIYGQTNPDSTLKDQCLSLWGFFIAFSGWCSLKTSLYAIKESQ